MSRRQNSSCDPCRKGKRACDAVWLRDRNIQRILDTDGLHGASSASLTVPSHGGLDDQPELLGPCTNCSRTNKKCTFEWVQSQQNQRKEKQPLSSGASAVSSKRPTISATVSSASLSPPAPPTCNIPLRALRPSITAAAPAFDTPDPSYSFPASLAGMTEEQVLLASCPYPTSTPDQFHVPTPGAAGASLFLGSGSLTTNVPSVGLLGSPYIALDKWNNFQQDRPPFMDVSEEFAEYGLDPFCAAPTGQSTGRNNDPDALEASSSSVWPSPTSAEISSPVSDHLSHVRKRRRTQSPARLMSSAAPVPVPPWDIGIGSRLARMASGNMIGETMMKIYHDVMEGALSCWLTEQTCPFKSLPSTPSSTTPESQQFWDSFDDMQKEWGPDWSNRVYRRVVNLDRMAYVLGFRKLSPSDESKVSHALNSAVMAFTTQWAQASGRSSARWPSSASPNDGPLFPPPPDVNVGEEFDRTLQKTFWNQARKALDDCNEIDSFRVVFAEIIFGLTQKYAESLLDRQDPLGLDSNMDMLKAVEDILREDNQQIWLERATRRLHVLRRRVKLYDRQLRNKKDGRHSYYDAECRNTIDLLFWLAVMFDTISAAMTERPLTVSDEDSGNVALTPFDSSAANVVKGWNAILAKDQQTKLSSLRWPCTNESISRELTDAAPVKVLLYRKVTRLQTVIARDMDSATIEDAIEDALMVYRHWGTLYEPLFRDCIGNHSSLSARIQSWYVCLFGHWLLATLLLAELIDHVDNKSNGAEVDVSYRGNLNERGQARYIRNASVGLISDLARASTPRHDDSGALENFHHAVNEGALLTEPWTMVLIRTFSQAAIILLEDDCERPPGFAFEVSDNTVHEDTLRGNYERCGDCTKALWYLGRKSDMARQIANVLGLALQQARLKAGV